MVEINLDEALIFRTKIEDLSAHCKPKRSTNLCFTDIKLEKVEKRHISFSSATLGISKPFWDKKNLKEAFKPRNTVKVIIIPEDVGLEQFFEEKKKNLKEVRLADKLDVIEEAMEKRPNGCKYLGWFFNFMAQNAKNGKNYDEIIATAKDLGSDIANQVEEMIKEAKEEEENYLQDPFDEDDFDNAIDEETQAEVEPTKKASKKSKKAKRGK